MLGLLNGGLFFYENLNLFVGCLEGCKHLIGVSVILLTKFKLCIIMFIIKQTN